MAEMIQRLQQVFEDIHQNRMQGLPMVNPELRVAKTQFVQCEHGWLGVLVTPWCMNLVLLPQANEWQDGKPGSKQWFTLPSGEYEFVLGSEALLGSYYSCSLFSPMFDFHDQATAIATAEAALQSVLEAPLVDKTPTQDKSTAVLPSLSRRNFLRGAFRG